MNPVDYCIQKAAPAGSTTYYALRYAPLAKRTELLALYAFRRELSDTVLTVSDSGVAQAKLAWWRQETLSAAAVTPAHPVLQAFREFCPDLLHAPDGLLSLIAGFEADLMQTRYLDFPGLCQYFDATGGQFASLLASRLAPGSHDWCRELGLGLSLATMVSEVGAHAQRGRIYIPISDMQAFGVTAADILNRRYSPAFTALMAFQTSRAKEILQNALQQQPRSPRSLRRQSAVLSAQAAMAIRLLDEIETDDYQVLHQHIALTPIRNLLVSWWGVHGPQYRPKAHRKTSPS